jgi:hypothetical protein
MPLISYQPWKAEKVELAECFQTIRQIRKYPIKVGDRLHHWQQQRSPKRRKLGESICTEIKPISISTEGTICLDSKPLDIYAARIFAIADGFENLDTFFNFFQQGYSFPFSGVVICWKEFEKWQEQS